MVHIAYSLMVVFFVLFILQELCWTKLTGILCKEENEKYGLVTARTVGKVMWLSLSVFFLVLTIFCAVFFIIPGIILFLIAAVAFGLNGIRISKTSIMYTDTKICVHGPGIHIEQPLNSVVSVQKLGSRIKGTWYLLILFRNGQKVRFEQINYQGLVVLHKVLSDCIGRGNST